MKSDQQLSLCPLQGCAPAPLLAELQSYKQKRKAVAVVSFSVFLPQNPSQRGRADPSHSLQPHCGTTTHCSVSSAPLFGQVCVICVPLPVPTVKHTVCDSDRNDAVGTSAQGEGTGKSMARESDHSRELLLELFVMVSSTIIIRNTSNNKY